MKGYEPEFVDNFFGTVKLQSNTSLTTGTNNLIHIDILVGGYGIDDGGHIKLAWPVSNAFGIPQFDDPSGDNFTTITTDGIGKLKFEFDHNAYIRPFMPCITIKVFDGMLQRGDTLTIKLGDKSGGSKGFKTQTYVENRIKFKIMFDPFGTNDYLEHYNSPFVDVIAGPAKRLQIVNQSEFEIDKPGWVLVTAEDHWGNLAPTYTGSFKISMSNGTFVGEYEIQEEHDGALRLEDIIIDKTGIFKFYIKDRINEFEAQGNPFVVREARKDLSLFWGDLHGQTGETVGSGTIDEYLEFGKKVAGIDFVSHAANAFQVTKEIWKKTQSSIKKFHEPRRYVTFLGYEWSGITSAGGDHNVYYLKDDMPIHRCSHAQVEDLSDLNTDRYPISELYKEFKGRNDVLIIPHIGGRRATLDVFDENLTPFIEIVSVHGHFDWFAKEALEKQLKTGFIGSSDTHSGRPGATFPVSYLEAVRSGMTAVYAKELTREDLWVAFKKRHVYATTGTRIIIGFGCEDAMMGDVIDVQGKPQFLANVIGTAPLDSIQIFRGLDMIYDHPIMNKSIRANKFIIRWRGARTKYRRKNIHWSGYIKIDKGSFSSVKAFAFDLPWEGIINESKERVDFASTTAGDYDGFEVKFDGDDQTEITFESEIKSITFKPSEIKELQVYDISKVELAIEILPMYEEEYPEQVNFEFVDEEYNGKPAAYYLKVLQVDGEKAWTSPIFINWDSKSMA
ncbi:MAG: DUF3604 domain-containing protein [Candidatus Kariarchaeaceae archaeon]|jgi:hypothetical protein